MTQSFKTDNKNRETFYNQACNKLQQQYGTTATESFRAQFSNHFDQKKWESRLASF
jgi:outer membrane protein assembly factor BamD (BamD/ComL family)